MHDVIVLGAGAAGLMCAITAGQRGRRVLVLDRANKPGKKILMSGGGRCNFTNYGIEPDRYLSSNPHFCKSALSRYTQWDFIELVERHRIAYHEKTLGQLFCDGKSSDILNMLLKECERAGVEIKLNCETQRVERLDNDRYQVKTDQGQYECESLVVATGGLSIPTLGGSGFGYDLAKQFGLDVLPLRAGLVPLTWQPEAKLRYDDLSGIAIDCTAETESMQFKEAMLFTHRGISGPAILQISSYWQPGDSLVVRLNPDLNLFDALVEVKRSQSKKSLVTILTDFFPKKVVLHFAEASFSDLSERSMQDLSHQQLQHVCDCFQSWRPLLNGTEGYRTAEVTLGGVDPNLISSKTMMVNNQPGLFFIGEVVDVTGWLGGYNFQWAWSSGVAAGEAA